MVSMLAGLTVNQVVSFNVFSFVKKMIELSNMIDPLPCGTRSLAFVNLCYNDYAHTF